MGVWQITAAREAPEWLSRDFFLLLATAGRRPAFPDDTNAFHALTAPDLDGRNVGVMPPEAKACVCVMNQTNARIVSQRSTPEGVELEVDAVAPSLVVLA